MPEERSYYEKVMIFPVGFEQSKSPDELICGQCAEAKPSPVFFPACSEICLRNMFINRIKDETLEVVVAELKEKYGDKSKLSDIEQIAVKSVNQ